MERSEPANVVEANLSGRWYNELGSEMIIDQSEGELTGTYINHAPDSLARGEKLIGSCGKGSPTTFGFVVNFEGGKFTTAWSGQYYPKSDDGEVLLTTWIMTANLQDANEYWDATHVGQDRFTRKPQEKRGRKLFMKL